jgi:hypothetical protein
MATDVGFESAGRLDQWAYQSSPRLWRCDPAQICRRPWPSVTASRQPGQVLELEGELDLQPQVAAGGVAAEQAADAAQPVGEIQPGLAGRAGRSAYETCGILEAMRSRRSTRSAVLGWVEKNLAIPAPPLNGLEMNR